MIRSIPRLLWRALYKFFGDSCPTMAAALSFSSVFSLPALLTLVLSMVGLFADPGELRDAIGRQVGDLIGPAAGAQVATILEHATRTGIDKSATAIVSLLALAFGATAAFAQLQDALNKVWGVKPDPNRSELHTFLAKRVFSFGVVIAVAFLALVSLSLSAVLSSVSGSVTSGFGIPAAVLAVLNEIVSFVIIAGLFAAMYKFLPDAKISWHDVWFGAAATALLFVIGKAVIGLYIGGSDPGDAFGAAGSLAVVCIWVYYSSMIVLYGSEVTRLWVDDYGRGVRPTTGAVEVVEEERTVQRG